MSIKRTKQRGASGRRRSGEPPWFGGTKAAEKEKSWTEDVAGQPDSAFVPYALTGHFPKDTLIAHATFGKGLVLRVEGARVEVLFESGTKKLGHAPA